jgi:hypothetical protein
MEGRRRWPPGRTTRCAGAPGREPEELHAELPRARLAYHAALGGQWIVVTGQKGLQVDVLPHRQRVQVRLQQQAVAADVERGGPQGVAVLQQRLHAELHREARLATDGHRDQAQEPLVPIGPRGQPQHRVGPRLQQLDLQRLQVAARDYRDRGPPGGLVLAQRADQVHRAGRSRSMTTRSGRPATAIMRVWSKLTRSAPTPARQSTVLANSESPRADQGSRIESSLIRPTGGASSARAPADLLTSF